MYNEIMDSKRLSREECLHILAQQGTPDHVIRHCLCVEKVAVVLARALNNHGLHLDVELVQVGGLLHDMCRVQPEHWNKGADLLEEMGLPEEAHIVRHHMTHTPNMKMEQLTELDIVCLADRMTMEDEFVGLERRMDYVIHKAQSNPTTLLIILAKKALTKDLIQDIEAKIGTTIESLME
ncbi:MAG: HD domain-containing protein [Alphaproteobacteria bacterium]|jgi:putative nucleotidyltransferase with HDIG domain|nr:HD domain-containing protein [Alphaproteobacteria bacterium]